MAAHIGIEESSIGEAIISPVSQTHFCKAETRPEAKGGLIHMISHRERGRFLAELEEARDFLQDILEIDGCCIAHFSFGDIQLPSDLAPQLRKLVGKRIGILRLDGYRIREII
jgi:hypothetical protein